MGEPLANDPHNACVGCGPANERGLRLRFERSGEGARASFAPGAWMEGWPGTTHTAFLYLALIETMNWTVYARRDRVGLPTRTGALETRRRVATGEPLTLEGGARCATSRTRSSRRRSRATPRAPSSRGSNATTRSRTARRSRGASVSRRCRRC